jgi:hypothetical protein
MLTAYKWEGYYAYLLFKIIFVKKVMDVNST